MRLEEGEARWVILLQHLAESVIGSCKNCTNYRCDSRRCAETRRRSGSLGHIITLPVKASGLPLVVRGGGMQTSVRYPLERAAS